MINRDLYLQKLIHNMWNGEIKVITGIRRCGKSVLLFDLFYNYLLEKEQMMRISSKLNLVKDDIISTEIQ